MAFAPLPLHDWPASERQRMVGVFTDIDDTLTTEGEITPPALRALADLKSHGLHVIPITGRPVGWSMPFAHAWPVDAIVAENGAVALLGRDRTPVETSPITPLRASAAAPAAPVRLYTQDASTRARHFQRMQAVLARIEREIPGATRSRDSEGRETDIAIDHSEFTHLPSTAIEQVVQLMRNEGMTATVSSIHINGWYGEHDKFSGACWIARELLGRDLTQELDRWVYVGDSTNDQIMFQHFQHSVGVANIQRFADQLEHPPRYITPSERGTGFSEVAQLLLGR
jgi:hydroxymethylpyrimidine pyrophosphatase-like HAD family hydrolase